MDILKMLSDLRQERDQIGEASVALERLAQGHGKRRGRPPAERCTKETLPARQPVRINVESVLCLRTLLFRIAVPHGAASNANST